MSALSYMQRRRSGIYEFRKRLPTSLAGKPASRYMQSAFAELINPKTGRFKKELVRSLHTSNDREAKKADCREALRVLALFDAAERALTPVSAALTETDIREIAEEERARLLGADDAEREEGDDRRHLQSREERERWPDLTVVEVGAKGMLEDHFLAYDEEVQTLRNEYRQALARRDTRIVDPETRAALRRRGVAIDPSSTEYRLLGMAILKAHVDGYDAISARQRGELVPTPSAAPKDRGPKLSEAFQLWKAGGSAARTKKPSSRTLLEAEHAVRRFIELHGDIRLGDLDRAKAREFRDALAKVPKRMPVKLQKLSLSELVARDLSSYPARDGATVNKLLGMLRAIVERAAKEGRMDAVPGWFNPFDARLRVSLDEREPTRELFTQGELRALFGSPVFAEGSRPKGGGGEAAFWFPLVALLSGMRLEEIAGLRIGDLAQDEDARRWVFEIRHYQGRSLKTASSLRPVPVHRELERLGLLAYREALVKAGAGQDEPLWPDVKTSGAEGRPRSAAWSKWFGRYLRGPGGVQDKRKSFHSFRHTFKRMCRDAGLSEELHDALTGHSGSGVGRSYGKGISLGPLLLAMDRIEAPKALAAVRPIAAATTLCR